MDSNDYNDHKILPWLSFGLRLTRRQTLIAGGGLAAAVALAAGTIMLIRTPSPVPADVRNAVDFPIYYPDPKKLPAGYTLNTDSFSAGNNAVVYWVRYDGSKKLVFTDQHKPSADKLKIFVSGHLPLHTDVTTPSGTATVGAIGQQSVVSLPTRDNSWLLITSASDIDQVKLNQVLKAIRRPGR